MKKLILLLIVLFITLSAYLYFNTSKKPFLSPLGNSESPNKPLLAYSFERLHQTQFPKTNIKLDRLYSETVNSTTQIFYFDTLRKPDETIMDRVSGVITIPKKPGTYPVVVMFRGFVPDELYQPGVGTQHVAEALAQHGFITLAPDFLGFGESNPPSKDSFEARFQTYTTALTLFSSLPTLNDGLQASYSGTISADLTKVGIWGHSNGGHIALTVLALSGIQYPTVVWAPVSKSFPYSILYYSDEAEDHGKALRAVLANFEHDYNTDLFSPHSYYQWIRAPLSIHQGDIDTEVPQQWSQDLVSSLKKDGISTDYHVYHGDHNMLPSAWSEAVKDSITFFDAHFVKKDSND